MTFLDDKAQICMRRCEGMFFFEQQIADILYILQRLQIVYLKEVFVIVSIHVVVQCNLGSCG